MKQGRLLRLAYRTYGRRLRRELQQLPAVALPRHVALIVDGNRRWAWQLGLAEAAHGHRAGAGKVVEFLGWCEQLGIRMVTLYLLSGDNLRQRSSAELEDLCQIIADLIGQVSDRWEAHHVGSCEGLPEPLLSAVQELDSERPGAMQVNLAIGYGSRAEITEAVRRIIVEHLNSGAPPAELAELLSIELISRHLYTGGMPDPDLIIRTSGEQRLSDFMLWQSAHSEFYFASALGPDLRELDFLRALRDYAGRSRRYGS